MEDAEFVRDAFPQHCYLETYHDGPNLLMDYYMKMPDGPLQWDKVPMENHIWMTFDFSQLEALIDQYNKIMPERPSIAGDEG